MKVTVYLSLLSLFVASDAWFINFNKSDGKKESGAKAAHQTTPPRKVVLVAKTVYVPVYASASASGDKSAPISDKLMPIAPVQAVGAVMADNVRQQPFDYSSMYLQPPPTYVMYNAGSSDVAAAYDASVPVASDVYGAAGPQYGQYVQYAAAPPQESWGMQYGTVQDAESPAAPYSPTGNEGEVTEGPTEAPTEAYTTV